MWKFSDVRESIQQSKRMEFFSYAECFTRKDLSVWFLDGHAWQGWNVSCIIAKHTSVTTLSPEMAFKISSLCFTSLQPCKRKWLQQIGPFFIFLGAFLNCYSKWDSCNGRLWQKHCYLKKYWFVAFQNWNAVLQRMIYSGIRLLLAALLFIT